MAKLSKAVATVNHIDADSEIGSTSQPHKDLVLLLMSDARPDALQRAQFDHLGTQTLKGP